MRRAGVFAALVVACGARTGLDVVRATDAGTPHEAGVDAQPDVAKACPPAPTPTVLASFDEGDAWLQIAQDDAYVYWTTWLSGDQSVRRVKKCGGTPEVLVSNQLAPSSIVVDDANAYFGENVVSGGAVRSVPKAGGAATDVAPIDGSRFLVLDGSTLYSSSFTGVVSVPAGGGATTLLAAGTFGALAVDATTVYVHADSSIVSIPKLGGAPVALAPSPSQGAILVDGDTIFYSGWVSDDDGFVRALTNGAVSSLAEGLALPTGIAFDAKRVYWVEQGPDLGDGTLSSVPRAGGASTVLATGQDRPEALVADATSRYWIDFGGQLMKVDKP